MDVDGNILLAIAQLSKRCQRDPPISNLLKRVWKNPRRHVQVIAHSLFCGKPMPQLQQMSPQNQQPWSCYDLAESLVHLSFTNMYPSIRKLIISLCSMETKAVIRDLSRIKVLFCFLFLAK